MKPRTDLASYISSNKNLNAPLNAPLLENEEQKSIPVQGEVRIDIKDNEVITNINIPKKTKKCNIFTFWSMEARRIPKNEDERNDLLLEIMNAENDLDARINNCDRTNSITQKVGAALVTILTTLKVSLNQKSSDDPSANNSFNTSTTIATGAIPIFVTILNELVTRSRDEAIKIKSEAMNAKAVLNSMR